MKNSSGAMNDSRILDFVNSVSFLCPYVHSYFSAWLNTNSIHCARYAISSMESLILRSSLLRLLAYIKWKAWGPGNNMLGKRMNFLTRRATDQLWSKNLHRYNLILKHSFCIGNELYLWYCSSFRNLDLALQFHFMLFSKIGSDIPMENLVSSDS